MEQKPLPPHRNQILDALPQAERERLFPHLRHVVLPLGMVIYESGARLRDIYFPTNSIVSLLYVLANGSSAEIAVVAARAPWAFHCSWEEKRPPTVPCGCSCRWTDWIRTN